ncbi:MAG: hypothetical protein EOO47_00080 [Flavobacterium sp.]|nr:MAG: hypothetical protein EOO47_00080 [Flavobacterium sp.]
MIKITSELTQTSGFKSTASVLEINSYTLTETVRLTSGTTSPMPTIAGKNITVNFSLYKSLSDKENNAAPFIANGFPYSINFSVEDGVDVDEEYVYNQVKADLNVRGFNTEFS